MQFKSDQKSISNLLRIGKQYQVPRFQREYSWDRQQNKVFIDDIIENIKIFEDRLEIDDYFIGTMLFIGDFAKSSEKDMKIVDGQQRLTTITILLSVIARKFKEIKEDSLFEGISKYILNKDVNDMDYKILLNETHNNFLETYIQDLDSIVEMDVKTEEESRIKHTYEFFYRYLNERSLRKKILLNKTESDVKKFEYVDMLKAVRDQVLNSYVIAISTEDSNSANKIFEILNAKGMTLSTVDLIKNAIFEIINREEPVDTAKKYWKDTHNNLTYNETYLSLPLYFRHYWMSKYSNSGDKALYGNFKRHIRPKNEKNYLNFLKELSEESKIYNHIVNPQNLLIFDNQSKFKSVNQSFMYLSRTFNIVQSRVIMLSLYHARFKLNTIREKDYLKSVESIENFHFAFNALSKDRPSALGGKYSKMAIRLREETDRQIITRELYEFLEDLKSMMPSYSDFEDEFIKLTYTNKYKLKPNKNNLTKYVLNKLENSFRDINIDREHSSIEHIISESNGEDMVYIGNLILLEPSLNERADNKEYKHKKEIFKESEFSHIKNFLEEYPHDFDEKDFNSRAIKLSKYYYEKILKLSV